MAGVPRNTTTRDRHRRAIERGHADCGSTHHHCKQRHPPCGICGEPIDYTLPHDDPWSYVVDHVIPLIHGGADDLDNKQAAHRCCNRDKADKLDTDLPTGVSYVTTRTW